MSSKELLLLVSCCALSAAGCSASRHYASCEPSCGHLAPACGTCNHSTCPARRAGRPYAHLWQSYCGAEIEHDVYGSHWGESYCSSKWSPLFGSPECSTCGGSHAYAGQPMVERGEQSLPPEPVVEWDEPGFPTPTPSPRQKAGTVHSLGLTAPAEVIVDDIDVAPELSPIRHKVQLVPTVHAPPQSTVPTVKSKKLKTTPTIELSPQPANAKPTDKRT